jgi:hypothetical protein
MPISIFSSPISRACQLPSSQCPVRKYRNVQGQGKRAGVQEEGPDGYVGSEKMYSKKKAHAPAVHELLSAHGVSAARCLKGQHRWVMKSLIEMKVARHHCA